MKYGESPIGQKIISHALETDQTVTFIGTDPASAFTVLEGNSIYYTTDVSAWFQANDNGLAGSNMAGVGIDTLIAHEIGHTSLGRSALGLNEINTYIGSEVSSAFSRVGPR